MSKILETLLPVARGDAVSVETFNRLIRVLEINLNKVELDLSLIHI